MEALIAKLQLQYETFMASKAVQDLENRYHALSDRDRLAVNVLVLFLGILLVYRIIIASGLDYLGDARARYEKQFDDYQWMQTMAPEAKKRSAASETERSGSLLSIASSTAKAYQISFKSFEPVGDDRVRLQLERVKFNDIVLWLGKLENEMGVSAVDISLDSTSPGYVNVRLTLQG